MPGFGISDLATAGNNLPFKIYIKSNLFSTYIYNNLVYILCIFVMSLYLHP
jgi:hypothetical protein